MGFNAFHLQREKGLWLHVLCGVGSTMYQFMTIRGVIKLAVRWRASSWEPNAKLINKYSNQKSTPETARDLHSLSWKPGNKHEFATTWKFRSAPRRSERADEMSLTVLLWWSDQADGHNGARGRWGWRGWADWWLQLSQRRGIQADSWSPVAPDMSVIEAHGIVFHCRGQPVQEFRAQFITAMKTSGRATGDET